MTVAQMIFLAVLAYVVAVPCIGAAIAPPWDRAEMAGAYFDFFVLKPAVFIVCVGAVCVSIWAIFVALGVQQ